MAFKDCTLCGGNYGGGSDCYSCTRNRPNDNNANIQSRVRLSIINDCTLCLATPDGTAQVDLRVAIQKCQSITSMFMDKGTGELCYIDERGIKNCISVCEMISVAKISCLKDVSDETPCHDCSWMMWRKGTGANDPDMWKPYSPPSVTSLHKVLGLNADGCPVALDDPTPLPGDNGCRFFIHQGNTASWVSIVDGVATKLLGLDANGCIVSYAKDGACTPSFGPLNINTYFTSAPNNGLGNVTFPANDNIPHKVTPQFLDQDFTNNDTCPKLLTVNFRALICPGTTGSNVQGSVGYQAEFSLPSVSGKSVIREYNDVGHKPIATVGVHMSEQWVVQPGQTVKVQIWAYVRSISGFLGTGLFGQDRTSFAPNQIAEANFGGYTFVKYQ